MSKDKEKIPSEKLNLEEQFPHAERSPHTEDMVDHYWYSINYVHNLIKASELKAGLILSFYGILLNFIYQARNLFQNAGDLNLFFYILFSLWGLFTVTSIFFSVRCFIPKIEDKFESNIFFFRDVISKYGDAKAFAKTFYRVSMDEEAVFKQLGQQVFINSKIADWKFRNVNLSIRLLAVGLGLFFLLVIYQSTIGNM